ncbi:MAG: sporulation/spore germination protein [Mastigocoleus sp.]
MKSTRIFTGKIWFSQAGLTITYPLILLCLTLGISSCASTPSSQNIEKNSSNRALNNPSTPAPTNTPNTIPSEENTIINNNNKDNPNVSSTPKPSNNISGDRKIAAAPTNILGKALNVTVYTSDSQCTKLVPKKVQVSANQPAENLVGQVLKQQDNGDFNLQGYRVDIKNSIATVDLRIAPDSERQLSSLSSCEQFALFNSVKKTLTSNSQLNIKEVKFTEKGEEILF